MGPRNQCISHTVRVGKSYSENRTKKSGSRSHNGCEKSKHEEIASLSRRNLRPAWFQPFSKLLIQACYASRVADSLSVCKTETSAMADTRTMIFLVTSLCRNILLL